MVAVGAWLRNASRSNPARAMTTARSWRALEACRLYRATLVIAKLDRLSRDPHFLLGLQKAGVKFVAADMPQANELTVGIMALVARQEREMTALRTREALAAAKARGKVLGRPKGHQIPSDKTTRARGSAANAAAALAFAERLRPVLTELEGLSANAAAAELDRRGIATMRGGRWHARSIIEVRSRLSSR
jgi:DNA invertase Pin-like site-specific DNA recombinase